MVGEIRDKETAEIAIHASLTGHLVLSTIHTNDARRRHHAPGRHGHRAVPRSLDRHRHPRAAPRARALPALQGAVPGRSDSELEELGIDARAHAPRRKRRRHPRARATTRAARSSATCSSSTPGTRPMFFRAEGLRQVRATRASSGRRGIYELLMMDDAVGPLVLKSADAQTHQARRAWSRAWTRCATTARARCSRA